MSNATDTRSSVLTTDVQDAIGQLEDRDLVMIVDRLTTFHLRNMGMPKLDLACEDSIAVAAELMARRRYHQAGYVSIGDSFHEMIEIERRAQHQPHVLTRFRELTRDAAISPDEADAYMIQVSLFGKMIDQAALIIGTADPRLMARFWFYVAAE